MFDHQNVIPSPFTSEASDQHGQAIIKTKNSIFDILDIRDNSFNFSTYHDATRTLVFECRFAHNIVTLRNSKFLYYSLKAEKLWSIFSSVLSAEIKG